MPTLSPTTLYQYQSIIKRLHEKGIEDEQMVSQQDKTLKWIVKNASKTGSLNSIKSFISAVRWRIKNEYGDDGEVYHTYVKDVLIPKISSQDTKQTLSETKMKKFMEWSDILALEPKAKSELGSVDYLLFSLYTLTPPVREDYSEMMITKTNSKALPKDSNYVVVNKDKSKWKFIFNVYKTSKTYGQVVLDVPEPLANVIDDYMMKEGLSSGDKLLGNKVSTTTRAITQRIGNMFEKLTGKNIGVSLLRHSYIQNFLRTKKTIKEKEKLSKYMLHSYMMQEKYDVIDSDKE